MKDFELKDDERDSGLLRKFVERVVLVAWVITAIGALAAIIAGHYGKN